MYKYPISAIVLAAGSSRRMGKTNKLLLPWKDKPLLRHVVDQILDIPVMEVIVVTGYQHATISSCLKGLQVRLVHNPQYHRGMTSSIQTGVRHAQPSATGYLICLSDMPLLTTEDYRHFLSHLHVERLQPRIGIPSYRGQTGNPVYFSRFFRQSILQHFHPEGCKHIVRSHPQYVRQVEMPSESVLIDIDTTEDYDRWAKCS